MNFAIIGCGRHASQKFLHIDRYIDGLRLNAVCDRNPSVLESVRRSNKQVRLFDDCGDLLRQGGMDFVIIATDPESHFSLAKLCLESGKHVLLEKPMTATLSEAEALFSLVSSRSELAMVGFHRRFGAPENNIRRIVLEGKLGKIRAIQVTHNFNDDSRAPVSGYLSRNSGAVSGVIYEYMSHEIDFLRFLFDGCTLGSFKVSTGDFRHHHDTAAIQLIVNNEIHASYLLCSSTTDYEEYRIFGSGGHVIFNRYRNTAPVFYSLQTLRNRPLRALREWWSGINGIRVMKYALKKSILQPYIEELKYFMNCIVTGSRPLPSVEEGLFVMQTIDRLYSEL